LLMYAAAGLQLNYIIYHGIIYRNAIGDGWERIFLCYDVVQKKSLVNIRHYAYIAMNPYMWWAIDGLMGVLGLTVTIVTVMIAAMTYSDRQVQVLRPQSKRPKVHKALMRLCKANNIIIPFFLVIFEWCPELLIRDHW
jgi:hypothetical protein